MDKKAVADILDEIAVLLELTGENTFKVRAYQNASRAVQALDRDLGAVVEAGDLRSIRGIGDAIAEKVEMLVETGRLPYLEALQAKVPAGLIDLLKIPGLGPKRVRELHDKLGIASLGELEYAAQTKTLETLAGFGEKMQAKVLAGIAAVKQSAERVLLSDATAAGTEALQAVCRLPGVQRCSIAGSLRRRRETIGDLDIVVSTKDAAALMQKFVELPIAREVIAHGETKTSVRLPNGMQLDLRAVRDDEFPYTLHHFTGSKEHNIAMRARAHSQGLKINEYGLWRGDERIPCQDEAAFFAALGLAEIPPELREDAGEIEAAESDGLPDLITADDIRGVLHTHSGHSDGADTIHDMALAAKQRGYAYIGLSDHSRSARYANGMQLEDVETYLQEIDELNAELRGIHILKGTECDILPDGRLDYPDDLLARFDFVVGSVHSSFSMKEAEMTRRVLCALESPFLDILGHPTGRLLLAREPYAIQLSRVLEAAIERGVAVEINANPHRLDLDWREVRGFYEKGGWVSINPDAHRTAGLDDMQYGVSIARKGWVTKERVLNALPLAALMQWLAGRRAKETAA